MRAPKILSTLRTGLFEGFERVFGDGGRPVTLPGFEKPHLVVRGHERFCVATGWRINRSKWEIIRLKVRAQSVVVQRDPVQVEAGRPVGAKEFMTIAVPGLDAPSRYAAGLIEFNLAFGANVDKRGWDEMWKRVGETTMLVIFDPSEVNHGQTFKI